MLLQDAIEASDRVKGWLARSEQELLYNLARRVPTDGAIVELGSWLGKSTIMLAAGSMAGSKTPIYAVDFFSLSHDGGHDAGMGQYSAHIDGEASDYLSNFQQNMQKAGLGPVVTPIKASTVQAAKGWTGPPVNLLFIDAEHTYKSVREDFLAWVKHCKPGARVVFHDYQTLAFPGVRRFVDRLILTRILTHATLVDSILHGELTITEFHRVDFRLALCPPWVPPLLRIRELLLLMKKIKAALRVLESKGIEGLGIAIGERLGTAIRNKVEKSEFIEFGLRSVLLRLRVKHLHGPHNIFYAPDELIVISVVRNGELYVKSFMDHYLSMGARHVVFLDNGSTDRTVEMLCKYDKVTVLQTDAPYQKYENTMKRYLAERFSKGRWHLCADIDELFDYPYSASLRIRDFLRYLNENRYTAVIAQMLDMFSDTPLAELESKVDDSLKEKYAYYDFSGIKKTTYWRAEPGNDKLKMHSGGIRNILFGTNSGLTKAPLVMMDGMVKTFVGWHHTKNARVADVSCVLKHYPFVSSFYTKVQDAVRTGRYGIVTTDEYIAYWKVLERNPNLNLKLETAKHLSGLEELIEEEFLVVSDRYRQLVNTHIQMPKKQGVSLEQVSPI